VEIEASQGTELLGRLKLARINDLEVLESGAYWPRLQPYFIKPHFRRLTYQLASAKQRPKWQSEVIATRGAGGLGDLDVAYVADRFETVLTITEAGLPDYCLTSVSRGSLEFRNRGGAVDPIDVGEATGVIYRGRPGTHLRAAEDHERLAVWIPAPTLQQRLAALLGERVEDDLEFVPRIEWETAKGQAIKRQLHLLTEEIASPQSFALSSVARQSFTDLLLYSLLQALPHNYSDRIARMVGSPMPRTVRRAEAFIRARAGQPIALHEVAEAAGCSLRALQLSFRRFRDTTLTAAIRQTRLEAVRQALNQGEIGEITVSEVAHQYGFTNPSRFSRHYRASFGISPVETLRQHHPRAVF
jgi:AraC-like DNA-binding protein